MDPLALATIVLAFATIALACQTREMVMKQQKGIEYQIKPNIAIKHYGAETRELQCVISRNDVFNLRMTVSIDDRSDTQELGCILISMDPDSHDLFKYSERFDLTGLLDTAQPTPIVVLKIRLEYYSFTGSKYVEEYTWEKCEVTEKGIRILPRARSPDYHKLLESP